MNNIVQPTPKNVRVESTRVLRTAVPMNFRVGIPFEDPKNVIVLGSVGKQKQVVFIDYQISFPLEDRLLRNDVEPKKPDNEEKKGKSISSFYGIIVFDSIHLYSAY